MPPSSFDSDDRIIVEISRDLEDIVPIFLTNREKELPILRDALATQDFRILQTLGHRMKGDGGGYGFDHISEIGTGLETAAKQQHLPAIEQHIAQLEDFLKRVTVVYR
jgi:HPt (histidine-containing phosphotransfer) domain-containing protein